MDRHDDLASTKELLARLAEAISAADVQSFWPAAELAALAADVCADARETRVWALS